jgi:D-xylose transport system substrate-binding protein
MMKSFKKAIAMLATVLMVSTAFVGCGQKAAEETNANQQQNNTQQQSTANKKIKIGLSMDTLKEERWQKDRDMFKAKVEELGGEVLVQAAQGDDALQVSQAENLISQGVDVLVVVPHNADACATIVEKAHAANIPVIAYDRLIKNSDVDLYISFDNVKVGELQAKYITSLVPKGNYVYIGGAPTDNNATLFKQGAMNVLKPLIDKGDIKLVFDQMSDDWKPENAQKNMENALTKTNNKVDAVVCANDGTAGGAIQALAEQKLDGKVPVSGQDADLAACMRIVEGKQAMTVYKPIKLIAETAAEIAMKMAKKEKVETNNKVNNGKIDVPSYLLEPVMVDAKNMADTVIKDGFHKVEEVYKNVPKDKWPAQ